MTLKKILIIKKVKAKLFCVWKRIYALRSGTFSIEMQAHDFKKAYLNNTKKAIEKPEKNCQYYKECKGNNHKNKKNMKLL